MLFKLRYSPWYIGTWNFAYKSQQAHQKSAPPLSESALGGGVGDYCPSMPLLTPRVVPTTVRRVMMVCITFFHTCFFIGF